MEVREKSRAGGLGIADTFSGRSILEKGTRLTGDLEIDSPKSVCGYYPLEVSVLRKLSVWDSRFWAVTLKYPVCSSRPETN